eukprot:CAMPEP_0172488858 /NCGR_PEP_ID=MMETSP1066-20121228/18564_1 /TAXON_ID=671091 /ORGANISM="Coscinodiscus wailesii, Strain CCMP2513" /LENGTH=241 /DNA_ID=CAMNT_0013256337 /DNA_START=350 /DNA_END=1075 /DNA_ORIENTATION=+
MATDAENSDPATATTIAEKNQTEATNQQTKNETSDEKSEPTTSDIENDESEAQHNIATNNDNGSLGVTDKKSQVKKDNDTMTDATSTNSIDSAVNGKDPGALASSAAANDSDDDPNIVKLKFLFANRDGLNVTVGCKVTDTVGEIKGALLSMWPKDLPECQGGGESLRLICMGKGILMPDSKTLAALEVPVFKTHPTPVNVSVKPAHIVAAEKAAAAQKSSPSGNGDSPSNVDQGCACVIL